MNERLKYMYYEIGLGLVVVSRCQHGTGGTFMRTLLEYIGLTALPGKFMTNYMMFIVMFTSVPPLCCTCRVERGCNKIL